MELFRIQNIERYSAEFGQTGRTIVGIIVATMGILSTIAERGLRGCLVHYDKFLWHFW